MHKTLCGGINTDKFIKFACFYLKISQVHVFFSNFSLLHMFFGGDHSILLPESKHTGGFPS